MKSDLGHIVAFEQILFNKFVELLDVPNSIAKLRELVIQLGVRGRLTERLDGESNKTQVDLVTLFCTHRGKKSLSNAGDIPFPIPDNWDWVAVGDCMTMQNGKAFKPEEWAREGVPIIRIQNLNNDDAGFNYCAFEVDQRFHVNDQDLLISWSGTPGTSFGAFIWNRGRAYLNQHIFRCDLASGIFIKKFLRAAINSRLDEMIGHAQGAVGLRHITKGKLESILIPLPPLAEQKRIVSKVDELMALCDRLEAQQQERETKHVALARASLARFSEAPTPGNLNLIFHKSYDISPDDLRKTILTLAVQGKLVPQDPDDEGVSELLERNLIERRRLGRTSAGRVQLLDVEKCLSYQIPHSWRWQALDDLLIAGPTNGFSPKAVNHETSVCSLTLSATTSGRFRGEYCNLSTQIFHLTPTYGYRTVIFSFKEETLSNTLEWQQCIEGNQIASYILT